MQSLAAVSSTAAVPFCKANKSVQRSVVLAHAPQRRRTVRAEAFVSADSSSLEATVSAISSLVTLAGCAVVGYQLLQQTESEQGSYEEREDSCPRCKGTGYEPCHCTRWSNDGLGCDSCHKTSLMRCRTCGGGGKARIAHVPLKIESQDYTPPF